MKDIAALLLSDGYKQVHAEQYPEGLTKLVSYMTPRMSRLDGINEMILFGLQAFCKEYLIEYFNKSFFNREAEEVMTEYNRILGVMLGEDNYKADKVLALHRLGYLPIEISALPEGILVPMHVPCIQITNTHEEFAWVVQWVESLLSSEIWKPCIHASVGLMYRKIADKYYDLSVEDTVPHNRAISDFGFRGMSCCQEAIKGSAAWLLSFASTATIPAVPYLEQMYNCDCTKEVVGYSAVSTEHSVMASNFAIDKDERTFIKRLLTKVYPNASFSMVSDTYDYWNLVDNILPTLKEEIMNHNGKLLIRPDSGDIVDISVKTIEHLWNIFGGTVNAKGYKVLDPHIGCIYGDGCTTVRVEKIYQILTSKGFAANCIVFGAGSLSFQAIEQNGMLNPYTRDTFSVAIKATYGVIDGKEIMIFKDPKTDTAKFKKSQKGICIVYEKDGQLLWKDGLTESTLTSEDKNKNMFCSVFRDGCVIKEWSLGEIRARLHKGKF